MWRRFHRRGMVRRTGEALMLDVERELKDLQRRVDALETRARRDLTRMLVVQDTTLDQVEEMNRRVAALELVVKASHASQSADIAGLKADMAALRRELPGMMADTLREVLAERDSVK